MQNFSYFFHLSCEYLIQLGRLTNLCRVKSKQFEIAITKILGNNMDAIIVDTTKTATECVAYVKVQYSGDRYPAIATYIPMDRLRQKTLPHGILKYVLNGVFTHSTLKLKFL